MEKETKISASMLQVYLKGIDYPAGKEDLVECARNNSAPERVINTLNRLPEMQYRYPTDVEKEFGKIR